MGQAHSPSLPTKLYLIHNIKISSDHQVLYLPVLWQEQ